MANERGVLDGVRVAILAADGVEQIELTDPRAALEAAGATVRLVSPRGGSILALRHMDKGDLFPVDFALADTDPEEYDALYLPGGAMNADHLRVEEAALEFARAFDRARKPLAAICHAPWVLVSANLVRGRTLTGARPLRDDVVNAGGHWVDQPAAVEGNWLTSRGPRDLRVFDARLIELLRRAREQQSRRAA